MRFSFNRAHSVINLRKHSIKRNVQSGHVSLNKKFHTAPFWKAEIYELPSHGKISEPGRTAFTFMTGPVKDGRTEGEKGHMEEKDERARDFTGAL
jgi:hypothetical protein